MMYYSKIKVKKIKQDRIISFSKVKYNYHMIWRFTLSQKFSDASKESN